jgi:hypothetical protein
MIKQATGQTTRGAVPINLGETTYEVYGRIGMFKIGVGYRTTPRAEAVFNFVWSSSDAEEGGVQIGTVGANRHQDISGAFLNVPPARACGAGWQVLRKVVGAQRGSDRWRAYRRGPFEAIVETQLRFMGGLSDVDWLVEQGLRDINTESSRWSFPILLGARIRF